MSSISVVVLLSFVVGLAVGATPGAKVPVPTPEKLKSRFEYEYKVLLKLVMLNISQKMCTKVNLNQDAQIKLMQQTIDAIRKNQQTRTGSVYTRWGRTTCRSGTKLVYAGYMAGGRYSERSATNPLCLPTDPNWGAYTSATDRGALLYGAEYETSADAKFFQWKNVHNHDVPCAVCRTPRATTIMVPGKNRCHSGWFLEYKGYLMGDHYRHADSHEYTCVDGVPETVKGGHADHDGYLLYLVEARCSSLKCPPYVNGRELTCAVCSQ